jgi:acetolactate synthase-1/2/3 large subunit
MLTKGQHPAGYAASQSKYWASFDPPARLDMIAEAAGGAFAKTVSKPEDLKAALLEGREAVRKGIPAVINVLLPPV